MKKIFVLDVNYPNHDNLYGDVFVHTRVKKYQQEAEVLVVSFFKEGVDYEYEGVKLRYAPSLEDIFSIYYSFKPDSVFIHFYDRRLFDFISKIEIPILVWVHGYEALGWYRRLFNYTPYQLVRNFHNIVRQNFQQMIGFRKLVLYSNKNSRLHFIFVSNWMKNIAQADAFVKIKNYSLIPNPIDVSLFRYNHKTEKQRKKILIIRSFGSRKYANDIAINAILILSKRSFFGDLEFTIYGKGYLFKRLTQPLNGFTNVKLNETFLPNSIIPEIHSHNGVFLCPTRQDAQGVSMCEAMSSGLVPVTTDLTAIPEFVSNNYTGLLAKNANQLANQLEYLYYNPGSFLTLSKNASDSINSICHIDNIVAKEISILKSL